MRITDWITILTISMALLPLFKDVKNHKYNGKNLFKKASWSAYVLLIIMGGIIYLLYKDNNNRNKEKIDSENILKENIFKSVDSSLKPYKLSINQQTKAVYSIDSLFNANKKTLDVRQYGKNKNPVLVLDSKERENPQIKIINKDTAFSITFIAINSTAFLRSYRFLVFPGNNDNYSKIPQIITAHYVKQDRIIPVNGGKELLMFLNRLETKSSQLYVVVEVKFENEDKEIQPILKIVYKIVQPEVNAHIEVASDENYDLLIKSASKYKEW